MAKSWQLKKDGVRVTVGVVALFLVGCGQVDKPVKKPSKSMKERYAEAQVTKAEEVYSSDQNEVSRPKRP